MKLNIGEIMIQIQIQIQILNLVPQCGTTKNYTNKLSEISKNARAVLNASNRLTIDNYEDLIKYLKPLRGVCPISQMQDIEKIIDESTDHALIMEYKKQFKSIKKSRAKITTLYRFMPINENTYKHLNSEKLYFANPKDFNDPFDCITFRTNNIRTLTQEKVFGHNRPLALLGCSFDRPIPVLESLLDDDKLRVRCFNKGSIDKISENWHLMMSHYAQDHKGIIIEYEFDKTKITNDHIRFLKVNYTDDIGVSDIKAGLSNKAKCWNYEKEYRFAYWRDNINSPIEIPLEELGLKISKIIFLCNTSQTDKDHIINSLNIDFNKIPQGNNKISLKSGAEIEMKQVVMKTGYRIEFEIIEQTISLDNQRLKAET